MAGTEGNEAARSSGAVIGILIILLAGFAYSGIATLRQYGVIFQKPAVVGPSATIDAYLAPVHLSSGEELRRAVGRMWRSGESIDLVVETSALSRQDTQQMFFAISYLLYPRPIALVRLCEPQKSGEKGAVPLFDGSPGKCEMDGLTGNRVIFVGRANPFPNGRKRQLSDMISLVRLP